MGVTQKDIADRLGISRTTVARVLNNSGPVDEGTRKKVLKVARELGYNVNPIAKSLAMKKKMYIYAFVVKSYNEKFNSEIIRGLKAAYREFKNYGVKLKIVELGAEEPERQFNQIEGFLDERQIDGIILTPLMEQVKEVIKRFKDKNIPVATLDMDIKGSERNFFVGPNYYKLGRVAAELMAKFIKKEGKILVISSSYDFYSVRERLKGFLDKIGEYSHIETTGPYYEYSLEKIYDITRRKFDKEITGIYTTFGTEYAVKALVDMGINREVIVIANDLNEEIEDCVKKGYVQAIVYQRPFMQGYIAGKKMFDCIFKNMTPSKDKYFVGYDILLEESLDNVHKNILEL